MGSHSWGVGVLVLALGLVWWAGNVVAEKEGEPAPPLTLKVAETSLGKIDGMVENSLVVSGDLRHAVFVADRNGKKVVVIDGKDQKPYDAVSGIVFSPDAKRVAYAATRDKKTVAVVDGQEGKEYDGVNALVFSANSKRFAYAANQGKEWAAVIDGAEMKVFETVGGLVFSPDSKRYAYVATFEVKNAAPPPPPAPPAPPAAAPPAPAVPADPEGPPAPPVPPAPPEPPAKKGVVVVDGVAGAQYDSIMPGTLVFSADSKHVAYAVVRGGKQLFVVDGEEFKECDAVSGFVFSDNSKHFAYSGTREGKSFVAVDGAEERAREATGRPVFSADSQHLAYSAKQNGKNLVVLDGTEAGQYDDVKGLAFSPDSTQMCYVAKRGERWTLITSSATPLKPAAPVDDAEPAAGGPVKRLDTIGGKDYDDIMAESIKFSPKGNNIIYAAKRGEKWLAVAGAQEGKEYKDLAANVFLFTPDSKHIVYFGQQDAKWLIGVDGIESGPYDRLIDAARIIFDSPTKFHTLAIKNNEVTLIEVELK